MKTNIAKIGISLLAVGLCFWSTRAVAQTATTVTTTQGAFTEYVPNSETVVVRAESSSAPVRYTVTRQTTVVDETGAPVAIGRISPGSQLAIDYSGTGDRLVASRIVVHRPATVAAPATTVPAVIQRQTTTTTTTTRPLTHDEKDAIKEAREERKKAAKEEIERKKKALEEAEDKLDDDD